MRQFWQNYIASYKGLSTNTWMLALVMFINQSGAMILPFMAIYMEEELAFNDVRKGIVLGLFGLGGIIGDYMEENSLTNWGHIKFKFSVFSV